MNTGDAEPQHFVHEHEDFPQLLRIVAAETGVAEALAEKDYWVTHTLWAMGQAGLRVLFKGGTSLSKGFGLIQRFSEDLDIKIEAPDLPAVSSWKSQGRRACGERQAFFEALATRIVVPGAEVSERPELRDPSWRSAVFTVAYPSGTADALPEMIRPFVQLEIGSARVTPGEERFISSWVHDAVNRQPEIAATLIDNRPVAVHCVLPTVTLLEKIEAISRRYSRPEALPGSFVRHYEDAERILAGLPSHDRVGLEQILTEMMDAGDIRYWPGPDDPAFDPDKNPERWIAVEAAWSAIESLFWGPRVPLTRCAQSMKELVAEIGPGRDRPSGDELSDSV